MIYCVGRNYADHAKELGNKIPDLPIIFFKPHAAIVESGGKIDLPEFSNNIQFEAELAVLIGKKLEITHFTIANDLTARDQQKKAQENKTPWALAKGFKQSCGLGKWISIKELKDSDLDFTDLEIRLTHNGKLAQKGLTKHMIFPVEKILAYIKEVFPLEPGDIILTGTPSGVGTVKPGDEVVAEIIGFCSANWRY